MRLKIKITKEVLEATKMCGTKGFMLEGSRNHFDSQNCAITYACRKLFPNCYTRKYNIYIGKGNEEIIIADLPQIAIDFISVFDKATPVERVKMKPFEFEVELIKEALDLITIDEITKILETSTTLEVV